MSEKLYNDVLPEVNIKDYNHSLRDNDIRHIRNSHGESTNEKYPVTKQDIKGIPWLVENYDKVYVVRRNNEKTGIIYVKAVDHGLVYYLEQITVKIGNEPLLINKQMIKTGISDIPGLPGLKDAITKKQSETEFLNDLKKAQQVYAQSVYQSHSTNTIPQSSTEVNPEATEKRSNRDPTATATVAELEKQNAKLREDINGTDPYMTQLQDWLTSEQTAEQTAQQSIEQATEQTTENTVAEQDDAAPNPANTLDPDTEVTPETATPPKTPEQTISEIADKIQKPGITSGKARIAAQQMYTEAEKYGPHRDIMLEAYNAGQNPKRFADGFQNAYISGTLGDQAALGNSKAAAYLTQEQREIAYELGSQAVSQRAKKENTNGGNTDLEAAGMSPPEKKGPQAGKPNLHSSGDDSTIEERREAFREAFLAGEISTRISPQKQAGHILGTKQFMEQDAIMAKKGDHPSYIREDLTEKDLVRLVVSKLQGKLEASGKRPYEFVSCDEVIGFYYSKANGCYMETRCAQVIYAVMNRNIHIVPVKEL